ncbi:hypothetical protein [Streptomyces sp. NBC_00859]|uniref:hypothetical protein n=1 Tax=Streptomyces sp. NBC_00859 TaxID=2903682 RepID=UPI00386EB9BB|nr:hypothetical protein OG584_00340 [Streptomyces sp. NBC_00859]WSZ86731.1 hypothetical protein OG584_34800 [Streptomyces sp. NBC_00859]
MRSSQRVRRVLIALGLFVIVQAGGHAAYATSPQHEASAAAAQDTTTGEIDWP